MPKETFFNLPEAKRNRVIEAALDEFARYTYYKASITRIVKRADIAKGSFYQYFDDKKDLFSYIIKIIVQKKMKYLDKVLKEINNLPFFKLLEKMYKAGIEFARDNPRLDKIAANIYKKEDKKILNEIMDDHKGKSNEFFKMLLEKGIEKGEVDEKIDIELTSHILTNINISLGEYIYEDNKSNYDDMEVINKMLYIIENGISSK